MRLIDAPVGLFLYDGEMCLKTEYIADWGIEAYIVSSGEAFWGGAKTTEERRYLEVTPIEAEPVRHGRWIFKDDDGAYPWTTKAICSECKEVIEWNSDLALASYQIEFAKKTHYCPNCGAKMDSED